ncbi:MAG: MBL fold metallo-hydrolase [Flavobacteriales bacterium]|nr:MBL fold metallo-hydrolase [Flavobacteriales bacterium]MBP9080410.1 MBL fold metallo-hydrolase [Flavobacteriales bacterium]
MHIRKFTFNPFQENTYVLHADGKGILIDPGCSDRNEERELADWLKRNGITPERVLLTHAHVDHVMGCAWVKAQYGLAPELHRADLPVLEHAVASAALFGVLCAPPPAPARFIEEGEVVTLGNEHLDVLFVPGHAPGHVAFFNPKKRFIISGDVLFQRSIGRTDLPGGDLDTLVESIRSQLYPLGDQVVVYCGHGPETTIGEERRENPFVNG